MMKLAFQFSMCLFCLGFLAGCGGEETEGPSGEPVPVSGTVTIEGQPAANVSLTFQGPQTAFAKTDAEGKFDSVMAEEQTTPGIVPGEYAISGMSADKTPIPAKTVTVTEGSNTLTIDLAK